MAKYGTFRYGTHTLYGTGAAAEQPTFTGLYVWPLLIQWNQEWVNEGAKLTGVSGYRGRQYYVQPGGDKLERVQPGEFTFTLDNSDLRFDPYYTSGPYYGHITPGKPVKFQVYNIATKTNTALFTGHVKDIRPTSSRYEVQIIAVDDLQWLADQDITIPLAYNVTVSEAINQTLSAADYPYPRQIDTSTSPVTYFDPAEANALDTIRDLADAGLGNVFVDRDGVLRYYDRTKTGLPIHSEDQAVLLKEITITQPWENVRNKVTAIANRYGWGPIEEVYRDDGSRVVGVGETLTYKITFEKAEIIQPVVNLDYAPGSVFQNFIPGVGWSSTLWFFTIWLTDITTTSATVNIRNNYINGLYQPPYVIRGRKLVNKKISFPAQDAGSISAYGPRRFTVDSPWLQDKNFAEAYASMLLSFLKTPTKSPVITLETRPDAFGFEIFDRVHLTSEKLEIDDTFDIGYIDFEWLESTGQAFKHKIYLQSVLYNTSTITPIEYNPELPPVAPPPVITPPGIPPGGLPPITETRKCLQAYMGTAGESGPYGFTGGMLGNGFPVLNIPVGMWFRSIYHAYPTRLEIDGAWQESINGKWVSVSTFDFNKIEAINDIGQVVAIGHLQNNFVPDGVRIYTFDNPMAHYVKYLRLTYEDPKPYHPPEGENQYYWSRYIVDIRADHLTPSINTTYWSPQTYDYPGFADAFYIAVLYEIVQSFNMFYRGRGVGWIPEIFYDRQEPNYYNGKGYYTLDCNPTEINEQLALQGLSTIDNSFGDQSRLPATFGVGWETGNFDPPYNVGHTTIQYIDVLRYGIPPIYKSDRRIVVRSLKLFNVCEGGPDPIGAVS